MKHNHLLLTALLTLLGLVGIALNLHADDFTYNANNYTCMQVGIDRVRFTLPTGNTWRTNDGVEMGNVYVSVNGGNNEAVFDWWCKKYSQVDEGCKIKAYKGGRFFLVGKVKDGHKTFTNASGEVEYKLNPNDDDDDHYTTTVEWEVPYSLRGKKLSIRVQAHVNWESFGDWHVPNAYETKELLSWDCPSAPLVSVMVNEPMLSYDRAQINQTMITYNVSASSAKWMKLHYTDAITNKVYEKELPASDLVGCAYIPADRPWKDIYIEAKVVNSEGHELDETVKSSSLTCNMLHHPKNFTVDMKTNGVAEMKWSVDEPMQQDISEGDFFEIQRNVMGETDASDPYWTTVSMEISFEQGKKDYTYTDNTLMDAYKGYTVAYRIRRSSTSMWSWGPSSGYELYQSPYMFMLPQIENASVERAGAWDEEKHPVKFSFDFGANYDGRGRRIIRSRAEWDAFKQAYPSTKEAAAKAVFLIYNAGDWKDISKVMEEDTPYISILMANDLTMGDYNNLVSFKKFAGEFDGGGHTLTYNATADKTHEGAAPFASVQGGVIKNLTVAGTMVAQAKFAGGLIGKVEQGAEPVRIENCEISSSIESQVEGDASSGGFVGVMTVGTSVSFKNCTFHGQLQGTKCNNNGGFVGVALQKTTINFERCLFDPETLPGNMTNCRTFVRADPSAEVTYDDKCYYTHTYCSYNDGGKACFVINNETDWDYFANMVNLAKGTDVNAILGADLTVSKMVGTKDTPYFGSFNGNGHKLTLNIKNTESCAAPFRYVGNATIKNLNVTGSVEGGIHTAGLIGGFSGDNLLATIENVNMAATITTTSTHAAGFFGHSSDGGTNNVHINNCLFDGKGIATGSGEYFGAFIGWGQAPKNEVKNCLEKGSYTRFAHVGMNYNTGGTAYGNAGECKNNFTYHNWSEVGSSYNNAETKIGLRDLLGSQWKIAEHPFPKTTTVTTLISSAVLQGKDAVGMSVTDFLEVYGNSWKELGGSVTPNLHEVNDLYSILVWDPRAQLKLRVNMQGENGVTSSLVDLSNNEDALNKHEFTYDLTRKCVEYDFDLMILRNNSKMNIFGTAVDGVYSDTLVVKVNKLDKGNLANYRFMNLAKIDSIKPTSQQSSVVLNWWTSGGESDFFRILRRPHTSDVKAQWTDTIATNLQQDFYEDKTVDVQQAYDYMVESVTQCEGVHIVQSEVVTEECEPTAMISGYVRMADGTAMAGVDVIITPVDKVSKGLNSASYLVTTDKSGYYEQRGLKYQKTGTFAIHIPTGGDTNPFTGGGEVTFTTSTNTLVNYNFYQDSYFVYSGHVYYNDTSIPVPGVTFKLDGTTIHDASRHPIETDNQGAFTLSIPSGAHSVQAVKDGHIFADNGFLLNPNDVKDKTQYVFEKNVPDIYIWDSTTVVLRGRVVGGEIQGSLPLGSSLSKNNLGDSLKIVMQLEGDNTSWLIRKPKDLTIKSETYPVAFGEKDAKGTCKDTTIVNIARHTLTIRPDSKTGEYELKLHPAKYKVIEVSAQGYATLFQQGKVGETIDLAFNVQGDTCEYNRIYHAVPTVEVTQFNSGNEKYFGVKKLKATDNIGNEAWMNLYYYKKVTSTDSIGTYSFGYPVFMAGSPYGWMLQACEKYWYNNKPTNEPDIVKLNGGTVSIKNYLIGTNDSDLSQTIELDDQGGGSYVFTPQNTTFTLDGDMALKTVSITLKHDSTYYDIKPLEGKTLKGYVMATTPKADGRKSIVSGTPQLFDILRDPPGSGSSAYIEEGSKLTYGYSADVTATLGASFKNATGTGSDYYTGIVAAPGGQGQVGGTLNHYEEKTNFAIKFEINFGWTWNYNYNIDISERIQTKTDAKWVGNKADLFIGATENIIVQDAMAVRVVPDSMYQLVKTHEGGTFNVKNTNGEVTKVKVPLGTTKVLATGTDDTGKPIYLIRDEVMQVSPAVKSTFVHSQDYIEHDLLPDLMKIRNSLLLPKGTKPEDAQKLANKQGYATYISKVDEKNERFGLDYTTVYPNGATSTGDSIQSLNNEMVTWISFLAKNEQEKLAVAPQDLVKRYDFDGTAGSIQYSEAFSTNKSLSNYIHYPFASGFGNVFDLQGPLMTLWKSLAEGLDSKTGKITTKPEATKGDDEENAKTVKVEVVGTVLHVTVIPIVSGNFHDKYSTTETHSKKTGFTLSAATRSSMTVDVYRTANTLTFNKNATKFNRITTETLDDIRESFLTPGYLDYTPDTVKVYSNFVFRTVGGVTCQPYEDQRVTKWYQPGSVLDVTTIPVDKPRIWIEEPVQSNVPFDQPARFTLHIANETDYPDRATMMFNYFLPGDCNPKGAQVCVDGAPLTGSGANITLYPAVNPTTGKTNVFTKEITVYPGDEFDYENLAISIMDPEDIKRIFTVNFSAHFIPAAGNIKVTTPSDHWVVNTESPYDGNRKAWYMPVRIEGFNVNGRGFDHIELQYKLTTQGEKDWVSVCSYYANDSLRAKASGVTDTIPSNGIIVAPFYGETDPVEQYYDLRAVVYARHAGGFLTTPSPILSGIKDTRLPRPFGTPEPADGILGIGDDIKIAFSETIAGNYLSNINNFEVLGTPISTDISTSTSLSFNGESTMAFTMANRNLNGKSFTVDVMVNPATDKGDMTVFAHGSIGMDKGMSLGITKDRHLTATVNGIQVVSDSIVPFNNVLQQIAYAIKQNTDGITITFLNGGKTIGSKTVKGVYEGDSPIFLGTDKDVSKFFKGEMLEFRLWNRAMEDAEVGSYVKKSLTGFENGLLDYYKLNEGEKNFSYDKASGSNDLMLMGHTWKRPAGISMKLDGKKGLMLNTNNKFNRTDKHDYTLMFWFRTNGEDVTLLSNGEANKDGENQINIGLKGGELYVRSAGYERMMDAYVGDNQWHHFTMTVSRSRNVANIYIDKKPIETFAADSLSGIVSDNLTLGATYVNKSKQTNFMQGNIDEIGMFESVLPVNLIQEYATHTPIGTMKSLMFYLNFEQSVHLDNNQMYLQPTGVSVKQYVDGQSKLLDRHDTLLTVIEDDFVDRNVYAPMNSNAQLENLKYSYVAKDNELLIDLEEPHFMIEKTNVYITVKEIPDMQGNLMASPLTMNLYVYRNPLRWNVKSIEEGIDYGTGTTFKATITNMSGQKQNFEINYLPLWITASQTSGTIDALGEKTITFEVSPFINIGTYNEMISLTGDNNMAEPLPITLKVRGEQPEWTVSEQVKKENQMMVMIARVKIDGVLAHSKEDILGVFDDNLQTLGVAHLEVDNTANANEAHAYLNIYGYSNEDGSTPTLSFKLFNAASGIVYNVEPEDGTVYSFQNDTIIGTATDPVNLSNDYSDVQRMQLKKGWNWVSFNLRPFDDDMTVKDFLMHATKWEPGDIISSVNGTVVQQWTYREVEVVNEKKKKVRVNRWDYEDKPINLNPALMYKVYVSTDKTAYFEGWSAYDTIKVHKGWNRIAYLSSINLPIAQALNEYTELASEGDVIKSQDAFAIATKTPSGLTWKGSLQYMETGKGYMLKRQTDNEVGFCYPYYWSESRYSGTDDAMARARTMKRTSTTMNIVASVKGVETEQDDRLVVYSGAERLAEAIADKEQNFYLNIGHDTKAIETLTFCLERGNEVVATMNSRIGYEENLVLGTPDEPTAINFTAIDPSTLADGKWYTISGIQLPSTPTQNGFYIHNGKVIHYTK